MDNSTRDEILIQTADNVKYLREDVSKLDTKVNTWFSNHDAHHHRYTYLALTTCLGLIITLIVMILKSN